MTGRYVELPNSLLIDLDDISMVAMENVNAYHVVMKRPGPIMAKLDRANFEALRGALGAAKLTLPPAANEPLPGQVVVTK